MINRLLAPRRWRGPAAAFGVLLAVCLLAATTAYARGPESIPEVRLAELPREAQQTFALIQRGGPFPYARDGVVFGNRESILPLRRRGYYHEYTAPTPGARNRGTRRIIVGVGGEFYYTDDHYQSFTRIRQ